MATSGLRQWHTLMRKSVIKYNGIMPILIYDMLSNNAQGMQMGFLGLISII